MSVAQLQLVKRKDTDNSDIDLVDLLSLPTELQYQGWEQATPSQQDQTTVDDVITLLLNAGNDNALAAALQTIDSKVKQTAWAQEPFNPIGIWLRSKLATESNARQSFIRELRRSPLSITDPLAYNSIIQQYQLGITRMPVWENLLAQSITSSAISANGGIVSYTVAGDAHARVAKAKIIAGGSATYLDTWMGVKSDRYGVNPANFVPIWALTTPVDVDTTRSSDATAVSGYKCVTTFSASSALIQRTRSTVGAQTANVSDQRGKYAAFLRAQITNSSLVTNVRIGQGFPASSNVAYLPRVQITGTTAAAGWKYYAMGTVKIPAIDGIFEQSLAYSMLTIAAEKLSGSGNLVTDCILLIPAEHMVSVSFLQGYGSTAYYYLITRPDRRSYAIAYDDAAASIGDSSLPTTTSWSLPSGSGVIVCAAQGANSAVADQLTPAFTVYPSYSSLRGSS